MPVRIQRTRKKGSRQKPGSVYVGRPSKWGNPVKLLQDCIYVDISYRTKLFNSWAFLDTGDIKLVLHLFERIISGDTFDDPDLQYWSDYFSTLDLSDLRGKDLSCWCKGKNCHAEILLKKANQ
jgi:hypothetical protein